MGGRGTGMLTAWTNKRDQGRNVGEQKKGYKNTKEIIFPSGQNMRILRLL
jgi:hypothetical protein